MNTKQSAISSQLSALDELKAKWVRGGEADDVEFAILMRNFSDHAANKAAEQYTRLRTRNEQLEAALVKWKIGKYQTQDRRVVARCEICWRIGDNESAETINHEGACELARLLADEQPADARDS